MNKTEFTEYLSEQMDATKAEAGRWLDAMIEGIHTGIKTEEGVKLAGLGSFSRSKRKARMGRNPQTGEELKIAAKWVPTFKAASQLKEVVQKKKK